MSEIYITSDTHFFHKNILKYQPKERPFADIFEMNEVLIERWNELVKPDDEIYHLGDFGFGSAKKLEPILQRLNGKKYFIYGNHDKAMMNDHIAKYFIWMKPYYELKIDDKCFILFHYPIHSWNHMACGAYQLYGHTHGQLPHLYHGRSMDIGVDTNNCYPYNIRVIIDMFNKVNTDLLFDLRNCGEV